MGGRSAQEGGGIYVQRLPHLAVAHKLTQRAKPTIAVGVWSLSQV